MRTLEQALARAESLRNFRDVNRERFERNDDLRDIVLLADEVERLRSDGVSAKRKGIRESELNPPQSAE